MNRRQRKKYPLRYLGYLPDKSTTPWARMYRARALGHKHIREERARERRYGTRVYVRRDGQSVLVATMPYRDEPPWYSSLLTAAR